MGKAFIPFSGWRMHGSKMNFTSPADLVVLLDVYAATVIIELQFFGIQTQSVILLMSLLQSC